jgi:hypothetical protein
MDARGPSGHRACNRFQTWRNGSNNEKHLRFGGRFGFGVVPTGISAGCAARYQSATCAQASDRVSVRGGIWGGSESQDAVRNEDAEGDFSSWSGKDHQRQRAT